MSAKTAAKVPRLRLWTLARWGCCRQMRTREEIEAALRFAEERYAAAESVKNTSQWSSAEYLQARGFCMLWAGRIDAYRFVLKVPAREPRSI